MFVKIKIEVGSEKETVVFWVFQFTEEIVETNLSRVPERVEYRFVVYKKERYGQELNDDLGGNQNIKIEGAICRKLRQ